MRSLADIPRHLTNFVHLAASHRYVVSWCRSGLGNRRVFSSPLSLSLSLCLYAMSSDSNLTSMGRGLEYDLWSGQFALDGARPSEFQAVLGQVVNFHFHIRLVSVSISLDRSDLIILIMN